MDIANHQSKGNQSFPSQGYLFPTSHTANLMQNLGFSCNIEIKTTWVHNSKAMVALLLELSYSQAEFIFFLLLTRY